ncbi:hypothetical protein [Picrophilus oshimae]|uniref:Uncharacterized protein n=1 Tax=Picrophilus torridus (strain ATCC 700027 / DSM 9790 / JCM 10055 / NBRC 100828 / KAW 2/3) TaxID=1122961 RepID=A0A8G2L761_PICTO|nr:hypothetical protein [Picrophilus oshimae]SMD30718.1 hypothetical protein SAMN02745355_0612 [Picrophilus oshimae DSM 9789]
MISSFTLDNELSGIIKNIFIKEYSKNIRYIYVTDLVNPAYSIYVRNNDYKIPEEQVRILESGGEMHEMARSFFENMPGFMSFEETVAGKNNLKGIIGRIDFVFENYIVEFKSKHAEAITIDDVKNKYIMDLEQCIFYAVMNKNDECRLVFVNDKMESYGFIVKIIKGNEIENEMLRRYKMFDDGNGVPKCRYIQSCTLHHDKLCRCDELDTLDYKWLDGLIDIKSFDIKVNLSNYPGISYHDLIYPRRYYHRIKNDDIVKKRAIGPSKYENNRLFYILNDAISESQFAITPEEQRRQNKSSCLNIISNDRYIARNIYDSKFIPYIAKVNNSIYERNPPETYVKELAFECANRNSETGYIIVLYPKMNMKILAYKYSFDLNILKNNAKSLIDKINDALKNDKPEDLDMCPEFSIDSCQFRSCSCRSEIFRNYP